MNTTDFTLPTGSPIVPENSALRYRLYGNKPHIYRIVFDIDAPQAISGLCSSGTVRQSCYRGGVMRTDNRYPTARIRICTRGNNRNNRY